MSEVAETTEQQLHRQIMGQIVDLIVKESYASADRMSKASMETELASVGMDSLDVVEVVMCMEDDFGVEIDDHLVDIATAPTLGDLVRWLDVAVQKKSQRK